MRQRTRSHLFARSAPRRTQTHYPVQQAEEVCVFLPCDNRATATDRHDSHIVLGVPVDPLNELLQSARILGSQTPVAT